MSLQNPDALPIIVKKKVVHGAHHGGAWKVAYADFVTAMMALFIVLWLMNTSDRVKKAVAGYFRDPSGKGALQGSGQGGLGETLGVGKGDMGKLKNKLESTMSQAPQLAKLREQVFMTVTGEGLRIELLETDVGTFFETGSAQPSASGTAMLKMLAGELGTMPNKLLIEGHTDARPFTARGAYSNWELSSDRANAARKLMQADGLRPGQVAEIRGFADQRLRKPDDPNHPSNRRVSIIVKYLEGQLAPEPGPPEAARPQHAAVPAPPQPRKTGLLRLLQPVQLARVVSQHHAREFQRPAVGNFAIPHHPAHRGSYRFPSGIGRDQSRLLPIDVFAERRSIRAEQHLTRRELQPLPNDVGHCLGICKQRL
jgi:chemotaxis protein MotB